MIMIIDVAPDLDFAVVETSASSKVFGSIFKSV